ncbi:MAG: DUF1587 domain-containing protein, partial [Lentisphaeraceae bacterium]|nr:DUF1587 domain-containing protein [Lentisphaeraceae bacterium]
MKRYVLLLLVVPYLQLTAVDDKAFFKGKVLPLLDRYCFDCHDPDDEESESPFLEDESLLAITVNRHTWKSVAAQIRNRTMPPKRKKKQPTELERQELANWIDSYLRRSALKMPIYAGTVQTRRLNRDEYDNTIRDLVGRDLKLSYTFPMDGGGGEGFDNNGETLFLPPLLMEKYLETAQKILDKTIITPRVSLSFPLSDEPELFTIFQKGIYEVKISFPTTVSSSQTKILIDG